MRARVADGNRRREADDRPLRRRLAPDDEPDSVRMRPDSEPMKRQAMRPDKGRTAKARRMRPKQSIPLRVIAEDDYENRNSRCQSKSAEASRLSGQWAHHAGTAGFATRSSAGT